MPRFLLDANLPPKLARALTRNHGLDVVSILDVGRGRLSDPQVIEFARRAGRVLVTLDRDFAALFRRTARPPISIVYLRVPNEHRPTASLIAIMSRFVTDHLDMLDENPVFITVTPDTIIRIIGGEVVDDG